MFNPTLRRIAGAGLAVMAAAAVAAPAASADRLLVRTSVSVPAPYDASALQSDKRTVDEGKGPVLLEVRHFIECLRGKERRKGYGPHCQWSSGLSGVDATVGAAQGQGDLFAGALPSYPAVGTNFHAGYMREGRTQVDTWKVIVRNDDLREADERFRMSVSATEGGTVTRTFTIRDDESRR